MYFSRWYTVMIHYVCCMMRVCINACPVNKYRHYNNCVTYNNNKNLAKYILFQNDLHTGNITILKYVSAITHSHCTIFSNPLEEYLNSLFPNPYWSYVCIIALFLITTIAFIQTAALDRQSWLRGTLSFSVVIPPKWVIPKPCRTGTGIAVACLATHTDCTDVYMVDVVIFRAVVLRRAWLTVWWVAWWPTRSGQGRGPDVQRAALLT